MKSFIEKHTETVKQRFLLALPIAAFIDVLALIYFFI